MPSESLEPHCASAPLRLCAGLLLVALAVLEPCAAQQPPRPEIAGRIVDESGAAVPDADVGISRVGASSGLVVVATDEAGRFASGPVEEGVYSAYVNLAGYILDDGARDELYRPGDTPTIRVVRGGVITGKVTNTDGEPVVAIAVSALRVRTAEGEPPTDADFIPLDETDDRGVYRIYGLAAGAYVVYAGRTPMPWGPLAFDVKLARIYYPSSADRPSEVEVQLGAETTNIDIVFRKVAGHSLSGTVAGAGESAYVRLLDAKTGQATGWAQADMGVGDGQFEFTGLADGDYDLVASQWFDDTSTESARRRVTIRGADVAGVTLTLARLGSFAGRIVWEDAALPESCPKPAVRRDRAFLVELRREAKPSEEHTVERGSAKAGGEFEIKNLRAGFFQFGLDLPGRHWYVAGLERERSGARPASVAGRPIAVAQGEDTRGYVVRLRGGAASLAGRVEAGAGKALPDDLVVHLVPAEASAAEDVLRYYEVDLGRDGTFALAHLAPGEYRVLVQPRAEVPATAARRPLAWDAAARATLRREAEATGRPVTLAPCGAVAALGLSY